MKDDVLGRNSAPTTAPVPTSLANQEPSLRLRRTAEPRSCGCERLVYLLVTVLTPAHVRVSVIEALRLFRYIWLYVFLSLIFAYTLFGLGQILEIYRVLADQFLVASDLFRSGLRLSTALFLLFFVSYTLYVGVGARIDAQRQLNLPSWAPASLSADIASLPLIGAFVGLSLGAPQGIDSQLSLPLIYTALILAVMCTLFIVVCWSRYKTIRSLNFIFIIMALNAITHIT